ncbi:hypothetical protein PV326_003296, partial [Microctonus aethiopoides]
MILPTRKFISGLCIQEVLNERLNRRVDAMLKAGLVQELLDFHERYNREWIKINT